MATTLDDQASQAIARRACRNGDLRRLRQELGFTVHEVGLAMDADSASISRWERNLVVPKGRRAVALGRLIIDWVTLNELVDVAEPAR